MDNTYFWRTMHKRVDTKKCSLGTVFKNYHTHPCYNKSQKNKSRSNASKPLSHTANPWKQVLTLPLPSRWILAYKFERTGLWKNEELVRDPAPRFVPTKFDHDLTRSVPVRVVTGLAGQNHQLFKHLINEPRLPWTNSSEILPQDSSSPSLTMIR